MDRKEDKILPEMNRRKFLKVSGAAGLALSSSSLLSLGSAHAAAGGADAAERAINGAKAIKSKMTGNKLTVMIASGCEGYFTTSMDQWEKATGVKININVVPLPDVGQKSLNLAITKASNIDITVPGPVFLPDLVEAGLALDITDFCKKYDPELGGPNGVIPPLAAHGVYKGRIYGLAGDGDVTNLFIRRDWMDDPENQKAFQDKFGYPLKPPVLFPEMFDQIKFFTNEKKKTYGGWLYMSPEHAKDEFLRLLISKGVLPLDKDMRPRVNCPEGEQTLEELIKVKPYLHPGSTTGSWAEGYQAYADGNTYCAFGWPSLIKYSNTGKEKGGTSVIVGKFRVCNTPGYKLPNGTILQATSFRWGAVYITSKFSKNPEMAYLYSQWLTSPSISAKSIPVIGHYFDPFRKNHLGKDVLGVYAIPAYLQETAEAFRFNCEHSFPEIQIRGGAEYMARLSENVVAAFQGVKTAKKALKDTEEAWELTTERYGRKEQAKGWNSLTSCMFGKDLRKAMGLGNPPPEIQKLLGES